VWRVKAGLNQFGVGKETSKEVAKKSSSERKEAAGRKPQGAAHLVKKSFSREENSQKKKVHQEKTVGGRERKETKKKRKRSRRGGEETGNPGGSRLQMSVCYREGVIKEFKRVQTPNRGRLEGGFQKEGKKKQGKEPLPNFRKKVGKMSTRG